MKKTASNAYIWTKCSGYVKAATDYIRLYGAIESAAAMEGKMAHSLAEALLDEMMKTGNPSPRIPEEMNGFIIPVDMKIKTNDYAHLCYSWMRRAMIFGGPHLWIEREVACDFLGKGVITRVDFALYDPRNKSLIVADLKYGHRRIEAEKNPQLIIGAKGIIDTLKARGEEVKNISLNIYQPNGPSASTPLDQYNPDVQDFTTQVHHIEACYQTESDDLTPGFHCRNCEARGACPAVSAAFYEAWDVMAHYNHIPENFPADILESMMREVELFKTLLRGYETGLEALVIARMKSGEEFSKWEFSRSLTDRKWDYEDDEIIEMGKSFGIDLGKRTLMSPKQAEMAGMPKEVIETLVRRDFTGMKLRKKSFKKTSN